MTSQLKSLETKIGPKTFEKPSNENFWKTEIFQVETFFGKLKTFKWKLFWKTENIQAETFWETFKWKLLQN